LKRFTLNLSSTDLIFGAIFLLAAILFVIGYNFSIPVLSKDEGWLLGIILEQRGLADVADLPGYPPMILLLMSVATGIVDLMTSESPLRHTGEIIIVVRLINVVINLLSLFFIYRITKRLSNSWAALLAAFVWALGANIFEHIRLALSEAALLMFITGSIFFMVESLAKKRAWLAIASTLMGLLAVATKYNVAPVLMFGMFPSLFLAWRDSKSWLKVFGLQILLVLSAALLLLFGYGAVGMIQSGRPTASNFLSNGIKELTNLDKIQKLFIEAFRVLTINPGFAMALLLLGGGLYLWKKELEHRISYLLIFLFALVNTWFVSSYLTYSIITDRYVAATSTAWLILIAIAVGTLIEIIPRKSYAYPIQGILVFLLISFWLLPIVQTRISSLNIFLRIDTRTSLSEWSDDSLPTGTIALDGQHWYIFDPVWGGYHKTLRPFVARERWLDRPREDWLMANILYVQLNGAYPGEASILPFDNIYHLKSFPIPEQETRWTGDTFHIYRIVSDTFKEANFRFANGISLAAYELSGQDIRAGEAVRWLPYWRAASAPEHDYQLFLHLVPLDSFAPVAQVDLQPTLIARPSSTWDDTYETLVGNLFELTLPDNLPAGSYRLIFGLYRLDNLERLRTIDGTDYFEITQIRVSN
jgi:4-amino-4-deoxy-L-arabinose transferase-like glycosyltransferase